MHGTGHYHLNVKTGTRKTGQSAAAKYDYISRGGKYERARPVDIRHLESGNMPGFAEADPRRYWEAADDHERANGRVFRSMDMALPNELSRAEQIQLCQGFAQHVTGGELPYTLAIHAGRSKDGKRPDNPHMHLVFSERVNDGVDRAAELWFRRATTKDRDPGTGGAKKTDRTKPRAWLEETRADWAKWTNQALEEHGSHIRIDHRTLDAQRADAEARGDAAAARALNRAPQMHLGPILSHRFEDGDEAAPDRLQAFMASEAGLEQSVTAKTDELRDLVRARTAAYNEILEAVPHEALEYATEPIAAPPPAPTHSAADLAAEREERTRIAAVPAATWRAAEAATEPIAAPPPAPTHSAADLAAECEERIRIAAVPAATWRAAEAATEPITAPPPAPTHSAADLAAEREERTRIAAVPAATWHAAEAATEPITAPPPAPSHDLAALTTEKTRREVERAQEAARQEAARREQAQAMATRRMFQAATSLEAVEYEADQVARDLAARQPKDLPWDKVTTALLTQHSTEQRYTQRMKLGQGVTLDTGVVREELEGQILDRAPKYRFRKPPVEPKGLAAAISATVKSIQDAVDQVVDAILDRVLPDRGRNPAPDAGAMTAPEQREASADAQVGGGQGERTSPVRRAAARETTTREQKGGAATPYDDDEDVTRAAEAGPGGTDRAPEAGPGGTDRTTSRSAPKRSIRKR